MTPAKPLISTIIPVKDGEAWVAEAIESVLAQGYPRLELIVVDGHSSDRSAEVASSFEQVRLLAQDGGGLSAAWNQGIAESSGELIAFLDSDDRWLPGKLEGQVELLEQNPEAGGAIGLARFFLSPGAEPPSGMRAELLEGEHPAPMPGTLLVRREVFDQVGVFDTELTIAGDVDWLARVKDAGIELLLLDRAIIEKRYHERNLSTSEPPASPTS